MATVRRVTEICRMTSTRRALLVVSTAAAALAGPAGPASAAVDCTFNAAQKKVTITANDGDQVGLQRGADGSIAVGVPGCSLATVTNTDLIEFTDTSAGKSTMLILTLAHGGFAPGATAEPFGSGEIEIKTDFGSGASDQLHVNGPASGANIRAGRVPGTADLGVNLRADEVGPDADVIAKGVDELSFDGSDAADTFRADGGTEFDFFAQVAVELRGWGGGDKLVGGLAGDRLEGGEGDDELHGDAGHDALDPGAGDDLVDGGNDRDHADYREAPAAMHVDLRSSEPQDTLGSGSETFHNVESITGSAYDDVLVGDGQANMLEGGEGDDEIAPFGGPDEVFGDAGSDTVSYADRALPAGPTPVTLAGGVTVSLTTGDVSGVHGQDWVSVENVVGTDGDDVLDGDDAANVIDAGGGKDVIVAEAGDDTVLVRDGVADTVACLEGDDVVEADAPGVDSLQECEHPAFAAAAATGPAEGDTPPSGGEAGEAPAPSAQEPAPARALGLRLRAARRLRRGKLRATLTCDAACSVKLRAVVRAGGRRKVVLATRRLAAGRATVVALRMPRGAKRASLRATATSQDPRLTTQSATRSLAAFSLRK
jgi:Ca2+-binding RTX toxin-like protein